MTRPVTRSGGRTRWPKGLSANQDQYYTQDGLYQIKTLQRGTLNATQTGISGTPSWEEDWNYDPLGNWNGRKSAYQTKVAGTTTLNQNRMHTTVNEISGITTNTGPTWPTPGYDAAGNMTSGPQPLSPANGYVLTYDAWNRLVRLQSGNMVAAAYAYDGASRRTTKTVGSATRHYYYDDRWRVVEERLNTAVTAERRFVWDVRRLDDLILRDQASAIRLYALDDKINVTAVVDVNGTVQERYGYNGFGGVNYMDAGFTTITASAFDWETFFDSYRYDTESGLYQVRYRYLHPLLGRWITRDPIGYADGTNLYKYAADNPTNLSDPMGKFAIVLIPAALIELFEALVVLLGLLTALVLIRDLINSLVKCKPSGSIPNRPSGDCTPTEYAALKASIDALCPGKGNSLTRCEPSDSCDDLAAKGQKFGGCATARDQVNTKCFRGGDETHREEARNAVNAAVRCAFLWESNDCRHHHGGMP